MSATGLIRDIALLQVDRVIETEKLESPPHDSNNCIFGILNNYWMVYANYVLLSEEGWSEKAKPIVDSCLIKCKKILAFFEESYPIPKDKDLAFSKWVRRLFGEDIEDIDDCIYSSRDILVKAGFRDMDIDLYVACSDMDLARTRSLIKQGADPNVLLPWSLTPQSLPLPKDYSNKMEVDSVERYVGGWSCDFLDCYCGFAYWEAAYKNTEIDVSKDYPVEVCKPAVFQVIYNTVLPNIRQE